MKSEKVYKRLIVMMVVLAMVVSNVSGSKRSVKANSSSGESCFQESIYRKMLVGESYDFDINNKRSGSTYQWKSSNQNVASVNSKGLVKAKKEGTTIITCKITNNKTTIVLKAKVYVKAVSENPATGIEIINKITTMAPKETYDLNRIYSPDDVSDYMNWTSSNTNVATVNSKGVVTAKSEGSVTIRGTTINRKVSAKVVILVSSSVTVLSQEELNRALKAENTTSIRLLSKEKMNITIPEGNYSNKNLIISAPNATITNYGLFKEITIKSLKKESWYEFSIGNTIKLNASTHIVFEKGSKGNLVIGQSNLTVDLTIEGEVNVDVLKACTINIKGTTQNIPNIIIDSKNVAVHTEIPLNIEALEIFTLNLDSDDASKTKVVVKSEDILPIVKGKGTVKVIMGDIEKEIGESSTSIPTKDTTIISSPSNRTETTDDINGFDSKGRLIAYFGTPTIDGDIDEVWKKCNAVSPKISSGKTDSTASFKVLWDDNALYVLAVVKDKNLDATAGSVYNRDCIEIFVDELNDKTKLYGSDDLQFRVNYLNQQSADHGDIDRFFTSAKTTNDGYIIEARIAFQGNTANDNVYGFELQVSDAQKGNRIATMNLFDQKGMAYDDTSLFGELILKGKKSDSISGLNPYDLMNLVKIAEEIKLERYTNGDVVQNLIASSHQAISDSNTTQKYVDQLYADLKLAIKNLKRNNLSYEDKECRRIPIEYKMTDEYQGKIENLEYNTFTYTQDNKSVVKNLNVYLPYGYNQNDKDKKYDVLYLIHGMGENQNTVFGGPGQNTELMKILDNMIANGELEPMIVVTPTWLVPGSNLSMFQLVENFHHELVNEIIPLVEGKYNTYAASTSETDLKNAREHRAFGGFSMGSGCTWYNYISCLDYFKYFMPMSLWCLQDVSSVEGNGTDDQKKAQFLADVAKKAGYGSEDYYIFCATGTDDMAYNGMVSQVNAMKELTDSFKYTADLSKGNFYFMALEGGTHTWNCVNRYLYNMLPDLFSKIKTQPGETQENGFDAEGRAIASFGSPVIDGEIDEVWNNAPTINPMYVNPNIQSSATFKVLWDDNALYILAQVKDSDLSVASINAYQQDSMEIFLDEKNDKTKEYGIDDLHFRVNYENKKTVDTGDASRFYTSAKVVDGGYQIEARVKLNEEPSNGKVYGFDLQINDASGTNRLGTTNIFDSTGNEWNDTSLFGNLILTGKLEGAVSGVNPYELLAYIENTEKLDSTRYTNFNIVVDTLNIAKSVANDRNATQEQINAQIEFIKTSVSQLLLTEEAANEKVFVPVPDSYRDMIARQGTVVSHQYETTKADGSEFVTKAVNVYLPYGYDANDKNTKYNVYYLMHGGGENVNTLIGGANQNTTLTRILDNMIANGDIEPLIVVTPTFYGGKDDIALFYQELLENIIPFVESTYNTYADSITPEGMKASRRHRAFGGFSMGSACTWYTYIHCLDYIAYFTPYSGECWAYNGATASQVAENLSKVAKDGGYGITDYYLFCATGTADIAYPNMKPLMDEMKKVTDSFVYSSNKTKGNFYFIECEDATHAWNWVNQYIYDILPDLFD